MSERADPLGDRVHPLGVPGAQWRARRDETAATDAASPRAGTPQTGADGNPGPAGGPALGRSDPSGGVDDSGAPPWQGGFRLHSEEDSEEVATAERPVAVVADPRSTAPELAAPDAPAAHAAGPSRRARRHRRGVLPNLVEAADVPEDAEGRVAFYVLAPPPDTPPGPEPLPAAVAEAEPGPLEEALTRAATGPMRLILRGGVAGWAPVVLLGLLFVAVFVAGMHIAR